MNRVSFEIDGISDVIVDPVNDRVVVKVAGPYRGGEELTLSVDVSKAFDDALGDWHLRRVHATIVLES